VLDAPWRRSALQPTLLVEIDERLSPRGHCTGRAYFERLGYRRLFVQDGGFRCRRFFSIGQIQQPREPDPT